MQQSTPSMQPSTRRPLLVLMQPVATCVLIVATYFAMPVEPGVEGLQLVLRVLITVVTGALITWQIIRLIARRIVDPEHGSLAALLVSLVAGVVFFALADFMIATSASGQFEDLRTKTDALYFALATVTTVGYGDVHATGQLARSLVSLQIMFNVVILATGVSVLTRELGSRADHRRSTEPR